MAIVLRNAADITAFFSRQPSFIPVVRNHFDYKEESEEPVIVNSLHADRINHRGEPLDLCTTFELPNVYALDLDRNELFDQSH